MLKQSLHEVKTALQAAIQALDGALRAAEKEEHTEEVKKAPQEQEKDDIEVPSMTMYILQRCQQAHDRFNLSQKDMEWLIPQINRLGIPATRKLFDTYIESRTRNLVDISKTFSEDFKNVLQGYHPARETVRELTPEEEQLNESALEDMKERFPAEDTAFPAEVIPRLDIYNKKAT